MKNPTPRKILADHNVGKGLPATINDTIVYGQPDTSLASTISTYSEFQVGVVWRVTTCYVLYMCMGWWLYMQCVTYIRTYILMCVHVGWLVGGCMCSV